MFGSGLTGWFWLAVFHEVACKVLTGSVVTWKLGWAWRLHLWADLLTWLADAAGRPQCISMSASPQAPERVPSIVMPPTPITSKWCKGPSQESAAVPIMTSPYKPHAVTSTHSICCRPTLIQCGQELHRVWISEGEDHWSWLFHSHHTAFPT